MDTHKKNKSNCTKTRSHQAPTTRASLRLPPPNHFLDLLLKQPSTTITLLSHPSSTTTLPRQPSCQSTYDVDIIYCFHKAFVMSTRNTNKKRKPTCQELYATSQKQKATILPAASPAIILQPDEVNSLSPFIDFNNYRTPYCSQALNNFEAIFKCAQQRKLTVTTQMLSYLKKCRYQECQSRF